VAATDEIFEYTQGLNFEQFAADRRTQLAIVKLYEIIGEAAYKMDPDVKTAFPAIEWSEMARMRHLLVHNYYEIRLRILWDTKDMYLPSLRDKINMLIQELESQ
jgi:uncharacterized protein with HEPN domain